MIFLTSFHLQAVTARPLGLHPPQACPRTGGTCPNILESNNHTGLPAPGYLHACTRLSRSGVSQPPQMGTMVSTLQLDTVPRSRDSLDTAEEHEACSVVPQVQKLCHGHLNTLNGAETEALHKHMLEQVIVRKRPGPKQGSRSRRLIFQKNLQDSAQANLRAPACLP